MSGPKHHSSQLVVFAALGQSCYVGDLFALITVFLPLFKSIDCVCVEGKSAMWLTFLYFLQCGQFILLLAH